MPKQHSSGGKDRLGSISKRGDRYLRFLFVAGALAVIRYAKIHGTKHRPWLTALLARRHTKVAAIALANKIARMTLAIMANGEHYKEPVKEAPMKEAKMKMKNLTIELKKLLRKVEAASEGSP